MSQPKHVSIEQVISAAKKAVKRGDFSEAIRLYSDVLQKQPQHPVAKKNLRKLQKDLSCSSSASERMEGLPQAQFDLLVNLFNAGQLVKLEKICRELMVTFPSSIVVLNLLGVALKDQGRLKESVQVFDEALRLSPDSSMVYNNRGIALQDIGMLDEAVRSFNKAVELTPDDALAYNNRGNAFKTMRLHDLAVRDYEKAIELDPGYVEAYSNLAVVLKELGRLSDALISCDTSLKLNPEYVDAYCNRGYILLALGRLEESVASYRHAIDLDGKNKSAASNILYVLNFIPGLVQEDIFKEHAQVGRQFEEVLHGKGKKIFSRKNSGERLRVGYVSADFRLHSVAYFFEPLLASHDRKLVEVYCYHNNVVIDDVTRRFMGLADHWRSIVGVKDQDVVGLIEKDKIDILVDLGGHTADGRLAVFACKPAPVQVTWLGYPNTTGLSVIDYRFTDDVADPVGEADELHSEKLVRLPGGFLCYQGDEAAVTSNVLPCVGRGYVTFGSFNNLTKVTHQVVELWSRVLREVPGSHLLLKARQFSDTEVRKRYLAMFRKEGVSEDHIELYARLENKEDHLQLYHSVDIGLDPFPYNGTTTTCEALWMGVPVVTMRGNRHSGRVGASIMTHIGLEECVAEDLDEYVNLAVKYASEIDSLAGIRDGLRGKMQGSALCDAEGFSKNIEKAYEEMWSQYVRGE